MAGLRYLIGPAEFDEWEFVHGLLRRSFAEMEGRIDPPSSLERMTPQDLAALAARGRALVAVSEGPVGCAFLEDDGTRIQCGKLAVDPAFRRRGILRHMLGEADAYARDRGRIGLELRTRIELVENHAVFEHLGFARAATRSHPGYDRPTSIVYRRNLAPPA